MKKNILFIVIFILGIGVFSLKAQIPAKSKEIPETAIRSFKAKYKKATKLAWFRRGQDFLADFYQDQLNYKVIYGKAGNWLETISEIEEKEMPRPVKAYIKKNYRKYSISFNGKSVDTYDEKKFYVELNKADENDPSILIYFDNTGNPLKTTEMKDLLKESQAAIETAKQEKTAKATKDKATKVKVVSKGEKSTKEVAKEEDQEREDKIIKEKDEEQDWVDVDQKVDPEELPAPVITYVKANYPKDYVISSAKLINKNDLGTVYEVNVKRQGYKELTTLNFDMTGKFIKEAEK